MALGRAWSACGAHWTGVAGSVTHGTPLSVLQRIAALRGEVAGTLGRFQRDRAVQAAWDAMGRVEDERDRQAAAAQDARERAAEISGLGKIWSDHVGTMGSLR